MEENILESLTDGNLGDLVNPSNWDLLWKTVSPFLEKFMWALVILLVGLLVLKGLLQFLNKTLNKTKMEPIVRKYLLICFKIVGWAVILITVLSYLGVSVTSLIAIISAAGVAVALALQNSLSNLASGILIIMIKPFSKGDLIDNLSVTGRIEEINLMNCKLHTLDNKTIIIPNNSLLNGTIINFSASEERRVDSKISISYDGNLQLAKTILQEIADDCPLIVTDRPKVIGVNSHSASSIDLDFLVWCKTPDYWAVYYYIQEETLMRFGAAGITIPFPQMDVHIKQDEREEGRRQAAVLAKK